jgi:hypothetical protein
MPIYLQGLSSQTPATLALIRNAMGSGTRRARSSGKRRKRRAKAPKSRKRAKRAVRRTRTKRKKARLVKGSAAAKRYMASIRRKRK